MIRRRDLRYPCGAAAVFLSLFTMVSDNRGVPQQTTADRRRESATSKNVIHFFNN